jgi:Tol biopolymer transport system component
VAPGIWAAFEPSADGRWIAWGRAGANDMRLTWFNRKGEVTGAAGPSGDYYQPRLSPEGDRVAFARADSQNGNRDIWYMEIARGVTARLTTDGANDWYPHWSPDAKRVLFTTDRAQSVPVGAGGALYIKSSMDPGRDEAQFIMPRQPDSGAFDWSRDGKWVSFGNRDMWAAESRTQ